jgi:hypothetical protein
MMNAKGILLAASYGEADIKNDNWAMGKKIHRWPLLPESSAKPLPDFIPQALREDYSQACRIRDLSPKASATLSRRVLQGMIRDFCGIARKRLVDEIRELRRQVDAGEAARACRLTPECRTLHLLDCN